MHLDTLRSFLSWTLIALFLVTTAAVLFFTFGYRFNFERGIFIYTGSVTIKSNPRAVQILLDGVTVPNGNLNIINQSIHVAGIQPGEHFLRVEADGFIPWEKKITVESGISTEFWNIILPRKEYKQSVLSSDAYAKAFVSPSEGSVFLTGEKDGKSFIKTVDKTSHESALIFESERYTFPIDTSENIEISWSDKRHILVPALSKDTPTILIINTLTQEVTDLMEIAPIPAPSFARFHPTDEGAFFVLSDSSNLFLIRPEEEDAEKRATLLASGISAYDLSPKYLYTLEKESGIVYRSAFGNEDEFSQDPVTLPLPAIQDAKSPLLTVYDEKRIAVYDPSGEGVLYNDSGERNPDIVSLGSNIEGVQFSNDGKKLLFFSDTDAKVLLTRDWEVQPARKTGDIIQVARFSSPLSSAQWTEDYEHIIFGIDKEVKIAELDSRDRRQIETLFALPDSRKLIQVLPSFEDNKIYLLTKDINNTAYLSSFLFPEEVSLFGGGG